MRDYGKIASTFWTGETGRRLRGDPVAQVLALYLVSCPASTMTGIFVLSLPTMAHETGLSLDQVRSALRHLHEVDFAHFDEDRDLVWVVNMLRYQTGNQDMDIRDKRVPAIRQQLDRHRGHSFVKALLRGFEGALKGLMEPLGEALRRPSEGPSAALNLRDTPASEPKITRRKALRSQDQDQRQEQEQEQDQKQPEGALVRAGDPSAPEPEHGLAPVVGVLEERPVSLALGASKREEREAVAEVVRHYRVHHPRFAPNGLRADSIEARKIRDRFVEGYTVEDLRQAIDGYHMDPHHLGMNERNQRYLDLELIVRDSKHVNRGIEFFQRGPPSGFSEKEKRGVYAAEKWIAKGAGEG